MTSLAHKTCSYITQAYRYSNTVITDGYTINLTPIAL